MRHGQQVRAGGLPVPVYPQVGEGKRTEQPSPRRALVVGAVALGRSAPVATRVRGIAGREAPEPERGQELAGAGIDHSSLPLRRERARGERDREDLVGPKGRVGARRTIDHVVARTGRLVPEAIEARGGAPGHLIPGRIVPARHPRERAHGAERIVPEGIDLDGLARARRHDPAADHRIHPRDLHAGLTRPQEPVGRVHADAVARALHVPADHVGQHREQLLHQAGVPRRRVIGAHRLDVPQRGVGGIVFGLPPGIGEHVGEHALVDEARERGQDVPRDLGAPRAKAEAGQADHGVPSPVAEPVVSRDHRHRIGIGGQGPPDDELVGGERQPVDPAGRPRRLRGAPAGEHVGLVGDAPPPCRRAVERRRVLRREHHGDGGARRQRDPEGPGVEIVVDGVEPALGLAGEAIPQIPLVRRRSSSPLGEHGEWPGALVGRDAQPVRDGVDRHAPAAGVCARVEVAVVHHRLEGKRGGGTAAQQRVAHIGCVGARLHPDALFDLGVGACERPHRCGAVEAKALDQPVAVRSQRSVRPTIGAKLPWRAAVLDRLVQLGDEERAAHGRLQRGHEQPVVAAGQESRDSSRRESPDAVGAEPLPRLGRVEAAAGLTADVEKRAIPADPHGFG